MGQIDKKLKNQLFKVAVDYIYKEHLASGQGELAKKIGISESALSRIMNDKKFVGDETLRKMNEAFGGIFNMAYFRGDDPHCMLMEDLFYYKQHPEQRLVFDKSNCDNPAPQESANAVPASSSIDASSAINAAIAAYVKLYEFADSKLADKEQEMADRLADKDAIIAEKQARIVALEQTIADKDAIIRARDARILDLERRIAQSNADDLSRYPFAFGAAEQSQSITKKESR